MSSKFYLPSKIHLYLRRLLGEYKAESNSKLVSLISNSKVFVHEATSYENYNGGTYGHDIKFFLPYELITNIPVRNQSKLTERVLEDLRICAGQISNEYINQVLFELDDENDVECQQSIHIAEKPLPDPNALSIWKTGCIRLFISHRDTHKSEARELADALSEYGVSAFVAHETIGAMEKWQKVILDGLDSMEIMLAFITDDFHESCWTNQEIGYALAHNIPIISLKLQNKDPSGFISDTQALKGNLSDICSSIPAIYKLLAEKLGNQNRMQSALIDAFACTPDWSQAKIRFDRLKAHVKRLSEDEIENIISAYKTNDQLHKAAYLINEKQRLKKFLDSVTDKQFTIEGNNIFSMDDLDIPF